MADLSTRREHERRHAEQMRRYEDRLTAWQEEEAERKPTIALLECEKETLESLMLRLRPVEADAQDG